VLVHFLDTYETVCPEDWLNLYEYCCRDGQHPTRGAHLSRHGRLHTYLFRSSWLTERWAQGRWAGDFRFVNDPGSLVGAASYQLALLVSRKKLIRECEECGEMEIPEDPRWRYHTKCGNRKRKREEGQRRKAESSG
jgi:hypothetical protein